MKQETKKALHVFEAQLEDIRKAGTWKEERVITTPQESRINTTASQDVLNLCANNYLGLSNDPASSRLPKAPMTPGVLACPASASSAAPS